MKQAIVAGAICLGFALLILSGLWATFFPATSSWTPEKGARMSTVKAQLNDVGAQLYKAQGRTYGGPDPATIKAEYDALTVEFEQLKTDFESATETPKSVARILKWSGISLAVLGVVGWYAVKQLE